MEKLENINAYVKETELTINEMKDMILRTAIAFGCRMAHMEDEELQDAEKMFFVLLTFNEILDMVE